MEETAIQKTEGTQTEKVVERPVALQRDPLKGTFLPGNTLGRGNPFVKELHRLRAALYRSVRDGDIEQVTGNLVDQAKGGDLKAIALLYDVLGLKVKQVEATVDGDAGSGVKLYVAVDTEAV